MFCLCVLFIVAILLSLYIFKIQEHFRLSKEKTQTYLKVKKEELEKEYEKQAVEYCLPLLQLALRWAPKESEVATIEDKPFPCGNTVVRCINKAIQELKEGKYLAPFPTEILEMANA